MPFARGFLAPAPSASRASAGNGPLSTAKAPMPCRNCRRDTMRVLQNSKSVVGQVNASATAFGNWEDPDHVQNALNHGDETSGGSVRLAQDCKRKICLDPNFSASDVKHWIY